MHARSAEDESALSLFQGENWALLQLCALGFLCNQSCPASRVLSLWFVWYLVF